MNDELAIDVRGMTKRFGERTVVDHIDLQVRTGEIYGFLGPNGSGKTTFIRMLCGLLRADDGSGTCLGHDVITESEAIKRQVGYMTQRFSFWEDLSIAENLDFVARMYGVKNRRATVQGKHRAARACWPAKAARRPTFRRLETAPRAGRLPDSQAEAAAARRADRGRRPEGAARFLGRDSPARGRRADLSHHHALHGRSRALPSAGLHRLRQTARRRHGRGGDRAGWPHDLVGQRPRPAAPGGATPRPARRATGRRLRHCPARQRRRRGRARAGDRALPPSRPTSGARFPPGWRTSSSA